MLMRFGRGNWIDVTREHTTRSQHLGCFGQDSGAAAYVHHRLTGPDISFKRFDGKLRRFVPASAERHHAVENQPHAPLGSWLVYPGRNNKKPLADGYRIPVLTGDLLPVDRLLGSNLDDQITMSHEQLRKVSVVAEERAQPVCFFEDASRSVFHNSETRRSAALPSTAVVPMSIADSTLWFHCQIGSF